MLVWICANPKLCATVVNNSRAPTNTKYKQYGLLVNTPLVVFLESRVIHHMHKVVNVDTIVFKDIVNALTTEGNNVVNVLGKNILESLPEGLSDAEQEIAYTSIYNTIFESLVNPVDGIVELSRANANILYATVTDETVFEEIFGELNEGGKNLTLNTLSTLKVD